MRRDALEREVIREGLFIRVAGRLNAAKQTFGRDDLRPENLLRPKSLYVLEKGVDVGVGSV